MLNIFIPGNVPSSKNSKQWTGKFLVHSKQSQTYYRNSESFWVKYAPLFRKNIQNLQKPISIEFTFIRGTRHKFDYVNPLQTILDLMVKHNWIDDDNADEVLPSFGKYSYDKNNPGVNIKIL